MSLRGRVIGLVMLMLLVSLSVYVAISWSNAKSELSAELVSARTGGVQTAASAFEDLPRSNHMERDLRQLVATFDGNRHLTVSVLNPRGQVLVTSKPALPLAPAPRWFASMLRSDLKMANITVPGGHGDVLTLRPEPASDIAALWWATISAIEVFAVAAAFGLALIYWVIGRALAPLGDLSRGLKEIGESHYREHLDEKGPPELHSLQRGFNAMASRLQEIDQRNRALEAQLLTIQDEERAEIASDLHDEIGPHLFAVALDADMIARSIEAGETRLVQDHLGSIRSAVSFMQRQVRQLIAQLRPTRAAELGLEAAIYDLVAFWRARQPEVEFVTDVNAADRNVPEPLRDVIYKIVQESVANALRHAETRRLSIAVVGSIEGTTVAVANRGRPRPSNSDLPGLGLISMRERVARVGGELTIDRGSEGWTIAARFEPRDSRVAA